VREVGDADVDSRVAFGVNDDAALAREEQAVVLGVDVDEDVRMPFESDDRAGEVLALEGDLEPAVLVGVAVAEQLVAEEVAAFTPDAQAGDRTARVLVGDYALE